MWIDPRFELFPVSQWERYAAIVRASPQWQSLLDEEGLTLLMLSPAGEPLLINSLQNTTEWCQVYQDNDAVIFSRSGMCP